MYKITQDKMGWFFIKGQDGFVKTRVPGMIKRQVKWCTLDRQKAEKKLEELQSKNT